MATRTLTVSLSEEKYARLETEAAREGVSVEDLVLRRTLGEDPFDVAAFIRANRRPLDYMPSREERNER